MSVYVLIKDFWRTFEIPFTLNKWNFIYLDLESEISAQTKIINFILPLLATILSIVTGINYIEENSLILRI